MEIVKLVHTHFALLVETNRPEDPFVKAMDRHQDLEASTKYQVAEGCRLNIWHAEDGALHEVMPQERIHPVFFENRVYHFSVEFNEGVTRGKIVSWNKEIEDNFSFRKFGKTPALIGTLNFGNDIGRHQLTIQYELDQKIRESVFGFEVFPVKLDYKNDYRKIVEEIQVAYPNLVLDFLKKTYHNFKPSVGGDSNEIIWWSIFRNIFNDLLNDLQFVVKNPHRRLQQETSWLRPEKIRMATPALEEEIGRFRYVPERKYLVGKKVLKTDIYENRFIKAALLDVRNKFVRIRDYISRVYAGKLSATFQKDVGDIGKKLDQLRHHPFFREIGEFEGFRQESLVLQRKTGYSGILKNWTLLKKGFSFFDGVSQIELKDIAELYEIWCFLEMKQLLEKVLGKAPESVELAELQINQFRIRLREGKRSRISFMGYNGEEIELFHELSYMNDFDRKNKTGSFTVNQKPDIVLRVSKNDLVDDQIFTYLFDAKYRLASDDQPGQPDLPPDDTINQMHRYRDAIFFDNPESGYRAKEVIGGYILYPGRDDHEVVRQHSRYFKSIKEVNIGAFPLLPGYNAGEHLLTEYLGDILNKDSASLLQDAPPQRGKMYLPDNSVVLIGMIKGPNRQAYEDYLNQHDTPVIIFNYMPKLVDNDMARYFAPYIMKKGIRQYYRITGFYNTTRNKVYHDFAALQSSDTRQVYVLSLKKVKTFTQYFHVDGYIRQFRYTRLQNLRNPKDGKIEVTRKDNIMEEEGENA